MKGEKSRALAVYPGSKRKVEPAMVMVADSPAIGKTSDLGWWSGDGEGMPCTCFR